MAMRKRYIIEVEIEGKTEEGSHISGFKST